MLPLILLTVVCVLTYSFEIIFGLAGTIIMLALMSFFYDSKTLVIYSTLPQILVATIGLARSPKTVAWSYLGKMLIFAALGGVVGLYLFYFFSPTVFHVLLAAAVTIFGIYLIIVPEKLRLHETSARALDTLAGASQALFGISGPIMMTRLLGTMAGTTNVRNYALAFFLPLNLFRGFGYLVQGSLTREILQMMVVSGPFIALALWFSNRLHFRVQERVFRRVVAWAILLGGLSLFYR